MLIEGLNQVYVFDRDNNVFGVDKLVFPKSQSDVRLVGDEHLSDTLVDAEMVIDRVKKPDGTFETIPRMLIYDIIALNVCIFMCIINYYCYFNLGLC